MIVLRGLSEIGEFVEEVNHNMEDNGFDADYIDKNCPLILWDKTKKEWSAIKGFRAEKLSGSQFLFQTEFIPLDSAEIVKKENIESEMKKLENIIEDEIKRAELMGHNNGRHPVFIIGSIGKNAYDAWSIDQEKVIKIWGYKSYAKDFFYSEKEGEEMIANEGRYEVYTPSKPLIQKAVLKLIYNEWKYYTGCGDIWVKRNKREIIDLKNYKNKFPLYPVAIKYVNEFYENDKKNDNAKYSLIEQKLDRFEELYNNKSIEAILNREYQMLTQAILKLENNED